jgi:hypothetical protein
MMKLFTRDKSVNKKIIIRHGTSPGPLNDAGIPKIQEPMQLFRRRIIVNGIPFGGSGFPSGPIREDILLKEVSEIVMESELKAKESPGEPGASSPFSGRSGRGLGWKLSAMVSEPGILKKLTIWG